MKKYIKIRSRYIGQEFKPLIIAEIGINHNGNLRHAKKLVDVAEKNGAEAVKVQIHIADEEMSHESKNIKPGNSNLSIYNVIKKNSLSLQDEKLLRSYIKKKKLIYIATPFSFAAVDFLKKYKPDILKIGSGECNNKPLIDYACGVKKPIIMSTGMNSIKAIENSIKIFVKRKVQFILLYCVNLYPTPINLIRLKAINQYKKKFKNAIAIGYSDHTVGLNIPSIALSLGAKVVEKHFVMSKKERGPDVSCSMDPKDLSMLISLANNIEKIVNHQKKLNKEENVTSNFAFHSIVAKKNIEVGEKLTLKNLTTKRPGTGDFLANDLNILINKKVKKKIIFNNQIKKSHLE